MTSGGSGAYCTATRLGLSANPGIPLDGAVQQMGLPPLPPIDHWLVDTSMPADSIDDGNTQEHLAQEPKRSVSASSNIELTSTKRDMPRLFFRPLQAVIAILLLAAALCASLTMLVTQSVNYDKQQTESTSSIESHDAKRRTNKGAAESGSDSEQKRNGTGTANQGTAGTNDDAQPPEHALSHESAKSLEMQSNGNGINLNTADATQLQQVKGIGPVMAQRIIDYRASIGRFSSVDQLLQVSGIGSKTLERIRGQVTV
ncbi:Helix-hairpin-helix motif-containing protein [Bifidobacterium commune]|uniref:Helix-hairpin-helix motif-containing protein n=1 Tax=Bifidobacterium commune TaxID=1505727 RepID=A0A1C4H2D2_9BIFI|nr:Helix-hairpin-helix motif-containing protein [Bifidobacterium commune]